MVGLLNDDRSSTTHLLVDLARTSAGCDCVIRSPLLHAVGSLNAFIHRFQVSRNVRDSHEILLDPAVTHESSNCHEFPLKPIISNEKLVVEGLTYCYFSCFYCFDTKLPATNQALAK